VRITRPEYDESGPSLVHSRCMGDAPPTDPPRMYEGMKQAFCFSRDTPRERRVFSSSSPSDCPLELGKASDMGLLGDTPFTIEAKIRLQSFNVHGRVDNTIVGHGNDIDEREREAGSFYWGVRCRRLFATFGAAESRRRPRLPLPEGSAHDTDELELGKWYHVAVVFSIGTTGDGMLSLYRDGVVIQSVQGAPLCRDCTLFLGKGGKDHLNGWATEIHVWPRALTVDELKLNQGKFAVGNAPSHVWGQLAMACTSSGGVIFGGWSKERHRYASMAVKQAVTAVLMVAARQQPGTFSLHVLTRNTVVEILEYLPLE